MVIVIEEPKQEGYNHSLRISGLVEGDYILMSVDGYRRKDGELCKYGEYDSVLSYVDVFEYNFFDASKRSVVEKKFDVPIRCSYFMSQSVLKRLNQFKIEEGTLFKLSMVKTKSGQNTYIVEKIEGNVKPTSPTPKPVDTPKTEHKSDVSEEMDVIDFDTANEPKINVEEMVKNLKANNFENEAIIKFLKGKVSESEIRKYL